MFNLVKPALKLAVGLVALTIFSSCSLPGSPGTPDPSDPAVGSKISAQDAVGYFPDPKVGLKYSYVSTEMIGQTSKSNRLDAEVAEVNGHLVKLRLSVGGGESRLIDVNTSTPPVLPASGLTFEGRENISVPAGNFNAQKMSYSQGTSNFNVWALKGIGIIRVLEQKANQDTVEVKLEKYQQ